MFFLGAVFFTFMIVGVFLNDADDFQSNTAKYNASLGVKVNKAQRSEVRLPRTWNSFFTESSIFHLSAQPLRFAKKISKSNRGKRITFPSILLFFSSFVLRTSNNTE